MPIQLEYSGSNRLLKGRYLPDTKSPIASIWKYSDGRGHRINLVNGRTINVGPGFVKELVDKQLHAASVNKELLDTQRKESGTSRLIDGALPRHAAMPSVRIHSNNLNRRVVNGSVFR